MAVTETIDVRTTTRAETIDITSLVRAAVKKSGIDSGIESLLVVGFVHAHQEGPRGMPGHRCGSYQTASCAVCGP